MSSLTNVLNIGDSALRAQQMGLNVTGNNIANVNTPGYSRQRANLTPGMTVDGFGNGVDVGSLTRSRDFVLDRQHRFEAGQVGRLEFLENTMSTIEAIFTEVAGGGSAETGAIFNQTSGAALTGAFSRFFNAFQDLANNPESLATRAAVKEEGVLLTEQFVRMDEHLGRLRDDLDAEFSNAVDAVNDLTAQISRLNVQILSNKADSTQVAGNLDDERDRLIDELSKLIDLTAREESDGTMTVSGAIGEGILLVQRGVHEELGITQLTDDGAVISVPVIRSTGERVMVKQGRLAGILEVRDDRLSSYKQTLDEVASVFVKRFNIQHGAGFGIDGSSSNLFFDAASVSARTIRLSDAILNNLDKIATAGRSGSNSSISAGTGDGSNALALSDIRLERLFGGGTQTVEEFYAGLIGELGADAKSVFTAAEGQRLVLHQIDNRRESLRGVSINEEATQLITFQRAYQAAARMVTVADSMMEAVINM